MTGAEDIRWDLTDLYEGESVLRADLATAEQDALAFAQAYHGRVQDLNAHELREALQDMESIFDRAGRAQTFAYLRWSTDTRDAARGALLQAVKESCTRITQTMLFFDVEWVRVDEDHAQQVMASDALARYRHHLRRERRYRSHLLSEAEEKVLAAASLSGRSAWVRYFTETMGGLRFMLDGVALSQQAILAKLHEGDRTLRRHAALAFTEGLRSREHSLTFIFNTLLAEKATQDGLRSYPHWIRSRNLANEISDETAGALIDAVVQRYDLVARYYTLKRRLLGYDTLFDYDRYAPLSEADTRYRWEDARTLVIDAYTRFHPRMGRIAEQFFEGRWIDAPVVAGKQGGAYSHGAVPSAHPYVLLNFMGRTRDVQTLAHELGHGVHQYLSRARGLLQADTPLTTAETASVFGELVVFQELLQREASSRGRLALLVSKIDDTIATVFRQVAMNRFEDRVHTVRSAEGELSAAQIASLWMQTQEAMFQGSVTLEDHYRHWWSYIPHFLHTPGYVYAYAFGELLVLALYARYQEAPDTFPEQYLELLAAGGSDWPHVLVGRLGIDLRDPEFWQRGLRAIEDMIARAEALAHSVGAVRAPVQTADA